MALIGNPIVSTDFPVDYKSGNGSTTAFTLSVAPASVNSIDVQISGVSQSPQTYTVSGTTLTFSAAPPSGTNNIVVRHLGIAGIPNVPATASVTSASLAAQDLVINGVTVGKGGNSDATSTALGNGALAVNTTGYYNTASGYQTLYKNVDGYLNNAYGRRALYNNTSGNSNLAAGGEAMFSNTSGNSNVALGSEALQANTTASNNTAVGYQAGYSNTTGTGLVAVGRQAGYSSNASYSTYIGEAAGYNATGTANTFVGNGAGYSVTTGAKNTILGWYNGNQGGLDIRTASNYIVLSDGDGNPRVWVDNNGNLFSPGAYANTTAATANAGLSSNGAFFRSTSALKYKQDIRDLESININKFRPVRYKSKCENDDQTLDHFGIVADEVDEAGIKELVNYGADGEVEGFQYERLTVVLLKAIQELNAKVEAQALEIQALKGTV